MIVLDPVEIGSRIRLARLQAGLSQPELAAAIDLSARQVQKYEAGIAKPYLRLPEIAKATSTTVGWLIGSEGTASEIDARLDGLEAKFEGLRQDLERVAQQQNRILRAINKGRPDSAQGGARVA